MSDPAERKIGKLHVVVQRDSCIGSGNCVKVAPDLFELDEEDVAAIKAEADGVPGEQVLEACRVCPVEALLVRDESGEQVVP